MTSLRLWGFDTPKSGTSTPGNLSELSAVQGSLQQKTDDIKALKDQVTKLSEDIGNQITMQRGKIEVLSSLTTGNSNSINEVISKLSDLENTELSKTLQEQINEMRSQLSTCTDLLNRVEYLETQLQHPKDLNELELTELTENIQTLQTKMLEVEKAMKANNVVIEKLSISGTKQQKAIEKFSGEIDFLKKFTNKNSEISEGNKESLEKSIRVLQGELSKIKQDMTNLIPELESNDLSALQRTVDELKSRTTGTLVDMNTETNNITELQEQVKSLADSLDSFLKPADLETFNAKFLVFENQISKLENVLAETSDTGDTTDDTIEMVNGLNEKIETIEKTLRETLNKLHNFATSKTMSHQKNLHQEDIEEIHGKIITLTVRLNDTQKHMEQYKSNFYLNLGLDNQIKSTNAKINRLKSDIKSSLLSMQTKLDTFNGHRVEMKETMDKLSDYCDNFEVTLDDKFDVLETEITKKLTDFTKELDKNTLQVRLLKNEVDLLKN